MIKSDLNSDSGFSRNFISLQKIVTIFCKIIAIQSNPCLLYTYFILLLTRKQSLADGQKAIYRSQAAVPSVVSDGTCVEQSLISLQFQ